MRGWGSFLLAMLLASGVHAHDVPIPPSECTFDQLELTVPEMGLVADVAPATDADAMRVVYEVATRTAQFTAPETRARPFMLDGRVGSLGFPQAFEAELLSSGDATFRLVGLSVTLDGETRLAPTTLTTGMLGEGSADAIGAPIGEDGRVTLVGMIAAGLLPAPLDDVGVMVRASCMLSPAPDPDQFVPVFTPKKLRLVLGDGGRLRAVLRGGGPVPDAHPMHLRVAAGKVVLLALDLPSGLKPEKAARFVGEASDGSKVRLRTKARGVPTHRLDVQLAAASLPSGLADTGSIDVLYEIGGIVARDAGTYRLDRDALRAK